MGHAFHACDDLGDFVDVNTWMDRARFFTEGSAFFLATQMQEVTRPKRNKVATVWTQRPPSRQSVGVRFRRKTRYPSVDTVAEHTQDDMAPTLRSGSPHPHTLQYTHFIKLEGLNSDVGSIHRFNGSCRAVHIASGVALMASTASAPSRLCWVVLLVVLHYRIWIIPCTATSHKAAKPNAPCCCHQLPAPR